MARHPQPGKAQETPLDGDSARCGTTSGGRQEADWKYTTMDQRQGIQGEQRPSEISCDITGGQKCENSYKNTSLDVLFVKHHKIATHRNNPDLNPIPPVEGATLPNNNDGLDRQTTQIKGYDSIVTITDHNCTKGVILIPCLETMGAEDLAEEYKQRAFPYIGLPQKIISDRDTQFTSHFAKEICRQLGIEQNISSTYHPQTDGQSEKTNQHVEMALRIFCNFQQNDWVDYLPVVQYMLNARVSETTKKAPFELWMGFIPQSHQPDRPSSLPRVEWHESRFKEIREQAQSAMKRAQVLYLAKESSDHTKREMKSGSKPRI
jgi:transposase InsO family protein